MAEFIESLDAEPDVEADTEPDSYMMKYHPYRKKSNPLHTPGSESQTLSYLKQGFLDSPDNYSRKKTFCDRVKSWIKEIVVTAITQGDSVAIAIAPGHKANPNPSGFMHQIVGNLVCEMLAKKPSAALIDGRKLLIRTKDVPKQAQSDGVRSEDTHRGTIEINPESPDCKNKTVFILDDIWTSGSTLRVCKEVVLTTKPAKVKLIAIGITAS